MAHHAFPRIYAIFTGKRKPLKRLILLSLTILFFTHTEAQIRAKTADSDSGWVEVEAVEQIAVSSDKEVLELQMLDTNGEWQPAGKLIITQDRRFYSQAWIVIVLALLVAFLGYLTMRFFLNKSRKDAITGARVAELERSALRAQMNPHFIFN